MIVKKNHNHIVRSKMAFQNLISRFENHQVDVLFLDVEMPEMSGFDVLDSIQGSPSVIFFTGKENYAAEAFDKDAVDYLVKPVKYGRPQL